MIQKQEDERTVKYLAKLVTGILLIALLAAPVLASVPCSPSAHAMACCGGAPGSAMAVTPSRTAADHREAKSVPANCCKLQSHYLAAVPPRRAQEKPYSIAVPRKDLAVFRAPAVGSLGVRAAHTQARSLRRSQASLCTFLL